MGNDAPSRNGPSILLVEDNEEILKGNKTMLAWRGYAPRTVRSLAEARAAVACDMPDAIVLDIMLPDGSGLDFMEDLRKTSDVPILLLTGLGASEDVVGGLERGGDDYLVKPYDFSVLLARLEALLRRSRNVPETVGRGALRLDLTSRRAFLGGQDMLLKPKEFDVLLLFVRSGGEAISAEALYKKAWGQDMGEDDNAVRFQVSSLRKKLEGSGFAINFRRGEGYRFEEG